jgi:ectoine hydroxylase-related dioxygenase (phytanoyl-CoA dioxygenase family)
LSSAEVAHFHSFGWVALHNLLDVDEARQLRDEIDDALFDAYGSAYGQNTRDDLDDESPEANVLPLMSERSPLSMSLVADDPRLWTIAEALLGPVTLASPALGECLIAETPWHRDPGIGDPWVRFRAYLVPCRAGGGALRFVPGSQHPPFRDRLDAYRAEAHAKGTANLAVDVPCVAVETDPGDVVAFDPRVLHSSTRGHQRLAWNADYAALPDPSDLACRDRTRELVLELSSWPHPDRWPVWDEWIAQRPRSTQRAEAIGRLVAIGAIEETAVPT